MSLRYEIYRYEKLIGENAEHTPIIKIGAFLDGVDKGIEELEQIKEEIEHKKTIFLNVIGGGRYYDGLTDAIKIIDKHISELKGESEKEE